MDISIGGKKVEKLNVRVSDEERERFMRESARGGYTSVSAWARSVLLAATNSGATGKPVRDIAIHVASDQIMFATNAAEGNVISVPAIACYAKGDRQLLAVGAAVSELQNQGCDVSIEHIVVEGHIVDAEAFCAILRYGFAQLQEEYDVRRSNVIITGRIFPSVTPHLRDLVRKSCEVAGIFTMELLMAKAVGAGLDVKKPRYLPVISVERDWIEAGIVYNAGLQRKLSVGTSLLSADEGKTRLHDLVGEYRRASNGEIVHLLHWDEASFAPSEPDSGVFIHQGRTVALNGVCQTFPVIREKFTAT